MRDKLATHKISKPKNQKITKEEFDRLMKEVVQKQIEKAGSNLDGPPVVILDMDQEQEDKNDIELQKIKDDNFVKQAMGQGILKEIALNTNFKKSKKRKLSKRFQSIELVRGLGVKNDMQKEVEMSPM